MWHSLGSQPVGGSFSARVPRSSAELHEGFVHHILEVEVDRQKEEQGNQREKDEEGEESGDVEAIRETHNKMTHAWMNECGPKLEPCVCARM